MMTIRDYLMASDNPNAYYKGCQIIEVFPVDEHYVLLTVRIPLPVGGDHRELVSIDAEVEMR